MSEIEPSLPRNSETSTVPEGEHHVRIEGDESTLAEHAHHHKPMRRRSSSGGSKHDYKPGHEPEHKPVEFMRPIEGTPAAEALAANKLIKVSKVTKGLHKIRGMKRPKMKNFNFVRKLNKTTKTKRKKKHFSKNFKGKVIDGVHELYTLTAGIMLGIRYTVGNAAFTATTVSVPDFTSVGNLAFPPNGSTDSVIPTPPHDLAHTFKFKSYAPKIFHRLREFFDISAAAYMDSVCGDYNFIEFISNSKSGQFFFYSHDGQYMLKTQTKEENKFMIRILPHYYQYLTENPNSLLVRILGMHRIKMYHLRRKVHFVVMTSVFDTPAQINTIYDLKGSLIGRSATQRERESGGVLKDNDLIADNCKLHLGAKKAAFMAQLEKDAMFLAKLNIMDYSLLVGIHHRSQRARDTLGPLNRESSSSVGGGSAAVVAAAAAAGSLAPQVGGVASPDPAAAGQVHAHPAGHPAGGISHSNTPFRRASINADGTYVNEASAPNGTPASTYRKKRSSTLESTDLRRDRSNSHSHAHSHTHSRSHSHHTSAVDVENISVSMSRSVSGDEDDHHTAGRNLFPSVNLSAPGGGTGISAGPSHSSTLIPESESEAEVEEETEGEEGDDEEEQDGEGEGEDFDESESEYEDVDAGDSDDEHSSDALLPTDPSVDGELVVEDGAGALGMEGYKLSEMLHADAVKSNKTAKTAAISGRTSTESTTNSPVYTYGPGQARRHPWTSRRDEGINSRTADGKRGDEIYYLGVIDILQQYNANKRMETLIKGVTNDSKQISSVSPYKYAKRFVSFMDSNID